MKLESTTKRLVCTKSLFPLEFFKYILYILLRNVKKLYFDDRYKHYLIALFYNLISNLPLNILKIKVYSANRNCHTIYNCSEQF